MATLRVQDTVLAVADIHIDITSTQFLQLLGRIEHGSDRVLMILTSVRLSPSISILSSQEMKVVIMDEPTKGVDVGAKAEIYAIMGDLAKKGYAIILISSEMPEILGMADRIIVMCNGRKTGELDRNEATQERILELAMEKSQNAGEGAAK